MNVNFGLFPPLEKAPSRRADGERLRGAAKAMAKRRALTTRALRDLDFWTGAVMEAAEAAPLVPGPEEASSAEPHPR
jgi:methylenetetrahydrofolate--tRNA-(uracil-5-)-methyltransferase